MNKKYFLIIPILLFMGCAVKINLNSKFYNTKKIGIYVISNTEFTEVYPNGSFNKYKLNDYRTGNIFEALKFIDININTKQKVLLQIENLFNNYKKNYVIINDTIDFKKLIKINQEDDTFYNKDLSLIKEKYNIDEIMFVNINAGILEEYYPLFITKKRGYCDLKMEIIDLDDNRILFKNKIYRITKIKGKWKQPPFYVPLKNSVNSAIDESLLYFIEKLNKE